MAAPALRPRHTLEEYLVIEEMSNSIRHEFVDGQIFAMGGGTPEHAGLCSSILNLLATGLAGRRCRAFASDLRIRVQASGVETYPDVSVVCGSLQTDAKDKNGVVNPVVLVEVTSPSTEAYDRGDKLAHFQTIPSVQEVMIVPHRARAVDVWRRAAGGGGWALESFGPGAVVRLTSIDCALPIDAIYSDPLAGSP